MKKQPAHWCMYKKSEFNKVELASYIGNVNKEYQFIIFKDEKGDADYINCYDVVTKEFDRVKLFETPYYTRDEVDALLVKMGGDIIEKIKIAQKELSDEISNRGSTEKE